MQSIDQHLPPTLRINIHVHQQHEPQCQQVGGVGVERMGVEGMYESV